jgi:undecaprenyl diphosphate synthase
VSESTPQHIAIVMDGNGRWAQQRNLPIAAGHKAGVEAVRNLLDMAKSKGVRCLTLYAFSSENWRRPKLEVSALMALFSNYLDSEVNKLQEEGICLQFIGRRDRFTKALVKKIDFAESKTQHNTDFYLTLAVDYGGRDDITQAAKILAEKVQQGELKVEAINEDVFAKHLALQHLPEPDLFIRTSGEYRISNFLLWQLSYAEFYFCDVLWPDFSADDFKQALDCFAQRDRRFGARPQPTID